MASKNSSSSMASVWDTLNKMKARQQAAATSVQKHRQTDTVRREAQTAFENAVQDAATADQVFAALFQTEAVRNVVDSHKQRLETGGDAAVSQELQRVQHAIHAASAELAVVAQAVRKGSKAVFEMSQ